MPAPKSKRCGGRTYMHKTTYNAKSQAKGYAERNLKDLYYYRIVPRKTLRRMKYDVYIAPKSGLFVARHRKGKKR